MSRKPAKLAALALFLSALCVGSAFAANISKLRQECGQQNQQACNKLAEIAKNSKERNSDRIEAIGVLGDQQLLNDLSVSDPNQYIKSAAIRRLRELVNIDFLRAIDQGDVGNIRTLAGKGADIDPHSSVFDVDEVLAVGGGYEYRLISRRGASSVMAKAIRSGHVESVRALVGLGADVKTEFFNNDMSLGFTSFISLNTIMDSVSLGLPTEIRGAGGAVFRVSRDGTVFSSFRPRPATKASYLGLAEQVQASTQLLDMLRGLSGAPKSSPILTTVASSNVSVQPMPGGPGDPETIIDVRVMLEKTRQFVPGLKSSNFRVYENGLEQKIDGFNEMIPAKYELKYHPTNAGQKASQGKISVELVNNNGQELLMQDEKHRPLKYAITIETSGPTMP